MSPTIPSETLSPTAPARASPAQINRAVSAASRINVFSLFILNSTNGDAERLSQDPTFRLIGSEKTGERGAALTSRLQWFETEMLAEDGNFAGLAAFNRELIARAESVDSPQRVVLDMDSPEIPVYGQQGHSADHWEELLLPGIERQQKLGKEVVFPADAAFAKPEIYEALEEARQTTSLAAPESLRVRMMKNTAPTGAVGCTINRAQEAILEILAQEESMMKAKARGSYSRSFGTAGLMVLLAGVIVLNGAPAPQKQPYTTWEDYGGGADAMQYSALKQINKTNVNHLELAWSYLVPGPINRFGFNPVIVDGVMYLLGKENAIVAVDAVTGKEIWSHPNGGRPTDIGINYWESKDRSDRRLIFSVNSYLQELDARTGASIKSFGKDGLVDMREGLGRDPKTIRSIQSGWPGHVFENLVLLGSGTGEGFGSPPGWLRAWDVITGKLTWTFHTMPLPGEPGYETWPPGAYKYSGGVNCWGELSIDTKRGIAYYPVGSAVYDFYGADRLGDDLYGNTLLALDARTGKRLWHFQVIHHDLWDYDLTTSPKLMTVRHNGKPVDIVAQGTKFGFLYVFDRVTGKPIWPIEERPVPKSDVPGEVASPTQPFPTWPLPFARQKFTVADINPYVDDAEKARLREILLKARNEGIFTPPTTRNTIDLPGELGGSNWGGMAGDPETGMLYVRSIDAPTIHIMSERQRVRIPEGGTPEQVGRSVYAQYCETCHGVDRKGVPSPRELGADRFRRVMRDGQGRMTGYSETILTAQNMDALIAYLNNPAAGDATMPAGARGGGGGAPFPTPAPPPEGQTRYYTPYGTWDASNGLPAIGPPWSQITAYDLNDGKIKWQIPFGTVPSLAAKGIKNTGSYHPTRNGLVVTAGGLLFGGTFGDRTLRAYDKDSGKVLWEKELESGPEGIPSVYEVGGRQYVVFGARTGRIFDNVGRDSMAWVPGKPEAQGYYVFALPKTASNSKK